MCKRGKLKRMFSSLILPSLLRGCFCGSAYYLGNPTNLETMCNIVIYGTCSYPILFYNYSIINKYIVPKLGSLTASFLYESVLWPINVYPLFCYLTHTPFFNTVLPVTMTSSVFWIPLTYIQFKKIPLAKFASFRLGSGFVYNYSLFKYQHMVTAEMNQSS